MTVAFFQIGMALDHWSHHRFANMPDDPDLQLLGHYRNFWSRMFLQRFRANRKYLKRALVLASSRPIPPEIDKIHTPFSRSVLRRLAWANFGFALFWLCLYAAIDRVLPGTFLILFVVPGLLGSWLSGLRSFIEHNETGIGEFNDTRSRVSWVFTLLHCGGNFHLEHHLYPSVPQWRLPKVHRFLKANGCFAQMEDKSLIDDSLWRCYKYVGGRYQYGRRAASTDRSSRSRNLERITASAMVTGQLVDPSNTNDDHVSTPRSRPLHGFEVVMAQLGESMGPDIIIGQIAGPMSLDLLRQAAFRIQQRHPGLRASIHWPDGRAARPYFGFHPPCFARLDVAEIEQAPNDRREWDPRPPWQQIAEAQSRHRFVLEHGFFFRLVWVPDARRRDSGTLICASHHAVVDGTSLMRLLNELLVACEEIRRATEFADRGYRAAARRLPPVVPLPPTPGALELIEFSSLEKIAVRLGKRQAVRELRAFTRNPPLPVQRVLDPLEAIWTQCYFRAGEHECWRSIREACTRNGVTVGGAFAAAVQFATLAYIERKTRFIPSVNGRIRLPISMDYDMRARLDGPMPNEEAVGLYTSIADVGVEVPVDIDFWSLATRLSAAARDQARRRYPALFLGATDTVFDLQGTLKRGGVDLGRTGGAGDGINVSNVGRYPYPQQHGECTLINVFGFNGACASGPMFIFWLRHVNGHLCYNAIAASPACDRENGQWLFDQVCDRMESCGVVRKLLGAPDRVALAS